MEKEPSSENIIVNNKKRKKYSQSSQDPFDNKIKRNLPWLLSVKTNTLIKKLETMFEIKLEENISSQEEWIKKLEIMIKVCHTNIERNGEDKAINIDNK